MKDKTIGVLMGGLSTERDVSLQSGAAVSAALRSRGYRVVDIDVGRDLPATLIEAGVQVAWLALHGRFGEDGCVQGLLEVMGIPYTGSDVLSSSVAMDKAATKRAVVDLQDVVLAADIELRRGEPVPDVLPSSGVVKPVVGGSTIGIRIETTQAGVREAIAAALALDPVVIVEEYVAGDEITVAVLDGLALPVVRILPESGFFDFEAKYTKGKTVYEAPAQIDPASAAQAQRAAMLVYRAVRCSGLARADFIVRDDGVPVFLEINTLPGMTPMSLSPMAASCLGMSFEDLVERILVGAHCMPAEV